MSGQKNEENRYRAALGRLRGTFISVALFSSGVNILMLTGPLFMMQVYDRVLGSGSVPTLLGLFAIVVILYGFLGFYDYLRVRLMSRAGYRLDQELGEHGFRFWLATGLTANPTNRRPLNDLAVVRGFLSSPALLGIFDMPWVPVYLLMVFAIHPWVGILTSVGALVVTALAILGQRLTDANYRKAMGMDAAESFFVEQSYRNAEAVLALGMGERLERRWRRMHDMGLAMGQAGGDRSEELAAISKAFRMLMQSATLALGAYLAIRQQISPGMIIATSIIGGRALAPIDQVIGQWRAVVRAREAHKRLLEVLAGPGTLPPPVALPDPEGHLSARGLTKFAPGQQSRGERPPILSDVTFALEPGDALGVIGPSASGKSTLAKILIGAWAPDAGEVRLDGATPAQWDKVLLGRHMGYLPQDLELMAGTIRDNICRLDPDATDAAVIEAAKIAGVHDMILSLPKGYGTELGHGVQPLSGGQIQRIGLARAVYGKPRVIVLDEPNSNLDAVGDEALSRAIFALREAGSVLIVMAHRPSAIAAVNKLLVLQNGQVIQFGDKETVLSQSMKPALQRVNHAN